MTAFEAPITAAEALDRLLEGSRRFGAGAGRSGRPSDLEPLLQGQRPWAAVVACADSRAAPEIVLDAGLGELFVIRAAGNVASPAAVASVAFAVSELEVPLVVVLGHTRCGAVAAAAEAGEGPWPEPLAPLAVEMAGLLEREPRRPGEPRQAWLRRLEAANAHLQAERLLVACAPLAAAVAAGRCAVEAALLELETGAVRRLGPARG